MEFEPIGGFPPFVRVSDNKKLNQSEPRGFDTNVVSISDIINSKKKENLFIAFGDDEENGLTISEYFTRNFSENPNNYSTYSY